MRAGGAIPARPGPGRDPPPLRERAEGLPALRPGPPVPGRLLRPGAVPRPVRRPRPDLPAGVPVTATWQRKPVRPPERELVTACYLPDLSGQDYRDMHAELSRVARYADPDAATAEASFDGQEAPVLVVRFDGGE